MKKKYVCIILALIAFPIVVFIIFCLKAHVQLLTPGEWSTLTSTLISYIGASTLSVVAIYQSDRANELSNRAIQQAESANQLSKELFELSQREYEVVFCVTEVSVDYVACAQRNINAKRMWFCKVDATPSGCQEYTFTLQNYGGYPITHMEIKTTYTIGEYNKTESLVRSQEVFIGPKESYQIAICKNSRFEAKNGTTYFEIKGSNYYGKESVIELSFPAPVGNESRQILFDCRRVPNITADVFPNT